MNKYELTEETKEYLGTTVYRIRALTDFADVKAGDLGGWIENEKNLSQYNNAWVYDNAVVKGCAEVLGNAIICNNAEVQGRAIVCDCAVVFDNAFICQNAVVKSNAEVRGNACVGGNAVIGENAEISELGDVVYVSDICSRAVTITIYRGKENKILVNRGWFEGTLEEFSDMVKATHGDNIYAKEYASVIELAKVHFKAQEEKTGC